MLTRFKATILTVALTLSLSAIKPVFAEPPATGPSAPEAPPAQHPSPTSSGSEHPSDKTENALPPASTTSHELALPGRALRFKAIAGAVRLNDAATLAPRADIATLAFLLDGADAAKRPVTFAINGGPGAASAWLNLGGIGPWRLRLDEKGPSPSQPPIAVENAETWLDFTDLVFIDPPGTGYSRILASGEETRRHFYSVGGDIDALAVTIRKWLTQNHRLESPKFLVGESYGGFRGPKLARRLQDEEGIGVQGLVLISPVLDFGWFEGANNPLTFAARLPSQAAAARGVSGPNGRAALTDVEAYAAGPYLADLLRGERDPQALERMADKVAALVGLDPSLVRKLGGRIDPATFARERGRAKEKVTSLYDAEISGFDPFPHAASSDYSDPVLDAVKAPLASAMADLTSNRFNWPVETRYEILNESVNHAWDFGGGRERPEALSDLKKAMALDSTMRVLVAHGITDQVTPYFASQLLLDQVPPMGDANRLRLKVYGGGHMLYFDDKSRAALREDARKLVAGK